VQFAQDARTCFKPGLDPDTFGGLWALLVRKSHRYTRFSREEWFVSGATIEDFARGARDSAPAPINTRNRHVRSGDRPRGVVSTRIEAHASDCRQELSWG